MTEDSPYIIYRNDVFQVNSSDILTHNNQFLFTGKRIKLSSTGTLPTGLSSSIYYWIIKTSDTTCKLAISFVNAIAGNYINITSGTGSGTHQILSSVGSSIDMYCDNLYAQNIYQYGQRIVYGQGGTTSDGGVPVSGIEWGDITGVLANQNDLNAKFLLYATNANPIFTGTATVANLRLGNITDSYIPYKSVDTGNMEDSPLFVNTANNVTVETNILVNTIEERTSGSGITIDGVLLKDSLMSLDHLGSPTQNKLISMTSRQLKFLWTNPQVSDGALELEVSGNFTGDVLHIHQHTGAVGATHLIHLEAEDSDVMPLFVSSTGTYAAEFTKAIKTDNIYEYTGSAGISLRNQVYAYDSIGSESYASGFSGNGWRLYDNSGIMSLTVDNLYVRRNMSVYQLEIQKVTSVGGNILLSPAHGTSISVADQGSGIYNIYFDEDGTNKQIQFAIGDIIMTKSWDGAGYSTYFGEVTAVSHNSIYGSAYVTCTNLSGTPSSDKEYVVAGNTATSARQNFIYMTSSDSNNPYIDILAGVTSTSWAGKTKVRLGNLTGITDATFGSLSGYGLYADNAYLTGQINAVSGKIGAWNINSTSIYTGTEDHNAYTGVTGAMTLYSNGTLSSIHANNFYVNTSGEIYAKGGNIGGFTLSATSLSSITSGGAWCNIQSDTGRFSWSLNETYCLSQQSDSLTMTDPYYTVALDNYVESTLYLPIDTYLPGSGSSTQMIIIHQYGTGLGSDKYYTINGNGNYINKGGTRATYITLAEGESTMLVWEPRSGEWYAIGGGSGGSMIYPGAGIPVSTGSAWGTSLGIANNTNNYVVTMTGSGLNGEANLQFDSATSILYVNGKVGIGTTAPTEKLEIKDVNPKIIIGDTTPYETWNNTSLGELIFKNHYNLYENTKIYAWGDFGSTSIYPDLRFQTQTVDRLTIKGINGNVGIGTTSPRSALHIQQDKDDGQLTIARNSNANEQLLLGFHAGDYGFVQAIEQGVAHRTLSLNPIAGKVGIGTGAPTGLLQVGETSKPGTIYIKSGQGRDGTGGEIYFNMTVGGGYSNSGIAKMSTSSYNGGNGNRLDFHVGTWNNDNNYGTSKLSIRDNGNVGIGTSSPKSLLEVVGSTRGKIKIANTTNTYGSTPQLSFSQNIDAGQTELAKIYTVEYNGNNNNLSTPLCFATVQRGTLAMTNRMSINNLGDIGIGTSDIGQRLHVYKAGNCGIFSDTDTGYYGYVRMKSNTAYWDIAVRDNELSGGFQFRPGGGDAIVYISTSGTITPKTSGQDLGTTGLRWDLYGGTITTTGDITANTSDKRLKTSIIPIENALVKVQQLNGFTYLNNDLSHKLAGVDTTIRRSGVFAQEVQEVLPEAVRPAPFDTDSSGNSISGENYLTVQYEKLVPLLIEAIKDLQQEIIELKNKN